MKQTIDIISADIVTFLKLLKTLIDVNDGKMIRLEISKAPINLIPKTIVIEVRNAINMLYKLDFVPVALAKFSSKVTAKIFE